MAELVSTRSTAHRVLAATSISYTVVLLDASIVNVALHEIGGTLGVAIFGTFISTAHAFQTAMTAVPVHRRRAVADGRMGLVGDAGFTHDGCDRQRGATPLISHVNPLRLRC